MDLLDRLARPAADLLDRVDDLLAGFGAPQGHRIWPLLRASRALPGDALAAVVALRAEPFTDSGAELRALAHRYADLPATLTGADRWSGAAADSLDAQRLAVLTHLEYGPDSLRGRLVASADFAGALADWVVRSRLALAGVLTDVLGSVEAVLVVTVGATDPARSAPAAAEIGAQIVATVLDGWERVDAIVREWAPRVGEAAPPPSVETSVRFGVTIRLDGR